MVTPAVFPPYPASLTPEERRAVMLTAARDAADAVIKEGGHDPAHVDRSTLEAEAAAQILAAWTAERVAALEARVAALEARGET